MEKIIYLNLRLYSYEGIYLLEMMGSDILRICVLFHRFESEGGRWFEGSLPASHPANKVRLESDWDNFMLMSLLFYSK